jgi:hypothetical protein
MTKHSSTFIARIFLSIFATLSLIIGLMLKINMLSQFCGNVFVAVFIVITLVIIVTYIL